MKEKYTEAELEITLFEVEDIIATSYTTSYSTGLDEDELPPVPVG